MKFRPGDPGYLSQPGEHFVDAPITCNITRFGLRSVRALPPSYRDYRRVRDATREAKPEGLLQTAFLLEGPKAWYSLSIWEGAPRLSSQVRAHIDVANGAFRYLAYDDARGPELWSTKWRLTSVTNNLNWGDFDLRSLLVAEEAEP